MKIYAGENKIAGNEMSFLSVKETGYPNNAINLSSNSQKIPAEKLTKNENLAKSETEVRAFLCEFPGCGRTFKTNSHLKTHNAIHNRRKAFQCLLCNKSYTKKNKLVLHQRVHDNSSREFVCQYPGCGKHFTQKASLSVHNRKHTGERPFICKKCGKSFTSVGHVIEHERIHTGDTPFLCSECGRRFNRSSTLAIHKRRHTGVRPYLCNFPECEKTFSQKGNLVTHLKMHSRKEKQSTEKIKPEVKEEANEDKIPKFDSKITEAQIYSPQELSTNVLPIPINFLQFCYPKPSNCLWFNPDVFSPTSQKGFHQSQTKINQCLTFYK